MFHRDWGGGMVMPGIINKLSYAVINWKTFISNYFYFLVRLRGKGEGLHWSLWEIRARKEHE